MMTNMDTLKKELKYVQEKLIRSIQAVSRVSMSESKSEQVIDKRLGDILDNVESACVTALTDTVLCSPSMRDLKKRKSYQRLPEKSRLRQKAGYI